MKRKRSTALFEPTLVQTALKQSFIKLDPRLMIRNPVMFTVEIGSAVMLFVTIYSFTDRSQGSSGYNFTIFLILLLTVLFANFAEALLKPEEKLRPTTFEKREKRLRRKSY